jgi:Arc/MetJ-type ribon-helix-helix transcriptional regulator
MTLTVRLDEELEGKLRKIASEEGESLSEFVRKAIEDRLGRNAPKKSAYEAGKHLFGRRGSGKGDLSVRSEEYFAEYVSAKYGKMPYERGKRSIGGPSNGASDLSGRRKELIRRRVRAKHAKHPR